VVLDFPRSRLTSILVGRPEPGGGVRAVRDRLWEMFGAKLMYGVGLPWQEFLSSEFAGTLQWLELHKDLVAPFVVFKSQHRKWHAVAVIQSLPRDQVEASKEALTYEAYRSHGIEYLQFTDEALSGEYLSSRAFEKKIRRAVFAPTKGGGPRYPDPARPFKPAQETHANP
jgi:hypothetical protein